MFREFVAEGAAEPSDELEAVLGGPLCRLDECWQHQTLHRTDLGGLVGALLPAEVFGPVGDAVFVLQPLSVEEEQVVGSTKLKLRGTDSCPRLRSGCFGPGIGSKCITASPKRRFD